MTTRRSVDLTVSVGGVALPNPVMTASGTAGYGRELDGYLEPHRLGAFVVKSLASFAWAGNPAPRLHPTPAGMLNSVGLQGPGVAHWLVHELPSLRGARVVASIWGRTVEDYRDAARLLAGTPSVVAIEVNLSCPNVDGGRHLFAHDPAASAEVIRATAEAGLPRWAKLSANTDRLVEVAAAVQVAGASAVTVANTMLGMVVDLERRRPALGGGGGGVSGRAVHPIAVRAVYEVHRALPELPIIGVGGIASGRDAVEMIMAGATAVQVGTVSFADPRAAHRVTDEIEQWCAAHDVATVASLTGVAHEERT